MITTGVGQHQMWAAQWYNYERPRHWVSSGGLGSMGFGLPSALGAAAAFDGAQRLHAGIAWHECCRLGCNDPLCTVTCCIAARGHSAYTSLHQATCSMLAA